MSDLKPMASLAPDHYIHTAACKECFDKFKHRLCKSAGCTVEISLIRKTLEQGQECVFTTHEMKALLKALDDEKKAHQQTSYALSDELWRDDRHR